MMVYIKTNLLYYGLSLQQQASTALHQKLTFIGICTQLNNLWVQGCVTNIHCHLESISIFGDRVSVIQIYVH
jgi:hypothetical protein